MNTTDRKNGATAVGSLPDTHTLRDIASVPPPPSAWPAEIIAHSLSAKVSPKMRLRQQLALALEWLWTQWEQWLPQPRLALAGTAATLVVAVSVGLWSGSAESQWTTADNLDYFALALSAADPYNLDSDLTW